MGIINCGILRVRHVICKLGMFGLLVTQDTSTQQSQPSSNTRTIITYSDLWTTVLMIYTFSDDQFCASLWSRALETNWLSDSIMYSGHCIGPCTTGWFTKCLIKVAMLTMSPPFKSWGICCFYPLASQGISFLLESTVQTAYKRLVLVTLYL
jgi:hypothetical protein